MSNIANTPLSVLDPSPIIEGGSAEQSLANTLLLAKKAEQWGYKSNPSTDCNRGG
ncbi:hypothetical protein AB4Z45_25895 [Paenibacillus sp. MCAF9]|uniref:hypothetical protein n=1 Tax=unclassified Paenibacillus TaxID=185978 RepID=UPI003F94CBC0